MHSHGEIAFVLHLVDLVWQAMAETPGRIYCVMENLAGGELYDFLHRTGPMPPEAAAEMLHGLVSAVLHMHERSVRLSPLDFPCESYPHSTVAQGSGAQRY